MIKCIFQHTIIVFCSSHGGYNDTDILINRGMGVSNEQKVALYDLIVFSLDKHTVDIYNRIKLWLHETKKNGSSSIIPADRCECKIVRASCTFTTFLATTYKDIENSTICHTSQWT